MSSVYSLSLYFCSKCMNKLEFVLVGGCVDILYGVSALAKLNSACIKILYFNAEISPVPAVLSICDFNVVE